MQERPEFDSTSPVSLSEVTDDERTEIDEALQRRAVLKAAEGEIPELP